MCYYAKTFEACHELTALGEKNYHQMLEREADRILERHQHPVRYFFSWIREKFDEAKQCWFCN